MHLDPLIPALVGTAFAVLLIGLLLRRLGQPQIIAYLAVGVAIGPHGLGWISDIHTVQRLGDAGVILLLFFVGMEISLPHLVANWRIPIVGTLVQIIASVGAVIAVGTWLNWPTSRSVLLGFVTSLSSTAIVIRLLQDSGEADTAVGRDVVGVLLAQDLALIPMLIVIAHLSGAATGTANLTLQIVGALGLGALLVYIARGGTVRFPLISSLRGDHEFQVFAAFAVCFGLAFLTGAVGLSTAVGAFVGGILVAAARETQWIRDVLEPFRVLLVAFFFVSIGMLLDLRFVSANIGVVVLLVSIALITNTLINSTIFRVLGRSWHDSWYGGALLAQIGEFSFVLAAVGLTARVISDFAYQVAIAVIALTMVASPGWIVAVRHLRSGGSRRRQFV
jgi:CPA2 family monovalent cation:H+ antiporter-2